MAVGDAWACFATTDWCHTESPQNHFAVLGQNVCFQLLTPLHLSPSRSLFHKCSPERLIVPNTNYRYGNALKFIGLENKRGEAAQLLERFGAISVSHARWGLSRMSASPGINARSLWKIKPSYLVSIQNTEDGNLHRQRLWRRLARSVQLWIKVRGIGVDFSLAIVYLPTTNGGLFFQRAWA